MPVLRSDDMPGTLYLVPTPIGDPRDITLRGLEVLRAAPVVAAEDTRHYATLARHHGLPGRAVSYHDHNETRRAPQLLARLRAGDDVALVTDAGTPLVSDPGLALVRAALAEGLAVTALPGASAVITALAASGMAPLPFRFVGFPPRTAARRRSFFAGLADDAATIVAFEAPHRLREALADARVVLGDREACVARNMTKPHERYQRGRLSELEAALAGEETVRGETTIVIAGAEIRTEAPDAAADAAMLAASGASVRTMAEFLARRHGLARRRAYELAREAAGA